MFHGWFWSMNRWGQKKIRQIRRQRVREFLQAIQREDT